MGRRWLWLLKGSTAASGRNTVANRLTVSNVVVGLVAEKDGGFGSSKRARCGSAMEDSAAAGAARRRRAGDWLSPVVT
ncbi:hypothetical protein CASFOL_024092 [Castilleja foliolosa]|uniref:Uncharacterized protein n=1 Tax=Castilleja foliolosa TaxID=1961234 RepID=A0ABD3CMC4_9LAMI